MAKLPRVTAKIFASKAAEGDIGQYGSALNGNKLLTGDISQIQALAAYETGWRAAVLSTRNYPTLQEMNGLQKTFSQQIAYLLNNGIPEYDAGTTYYIGDFVKVIENNIPLLKYSVIDENTGNNTSDTNYWRNFQAGEITSSGVPDVVIIGSPAIQNGQVSGFTSSDYVQYPLIFDPQSHNWEINLCFTAGADVNTQQNLLDSTYGIAFAVINEKFVISLSSNGSSWDIAQGQTGSASVEASTTYYTKLAFDGSAYKLSYSTNNTDFVGDITVTSSAVMNPANLLFSGTGHPFGGSINLNACNILVNGVEVWTGIDDIGLATKANIDLSNLSAAGEARFKKAEYPIGAPIPQMSANMGLADNEIYLEGAEVSKTLYAELYAVYGDTYGAPANEDNFVLPDLRNRALWGSDSFGYIEGILPKLEGSITKVTSEGNLSPDVTGAFSVSDFAYRNTYNPGAGSGHSVFTLNFNAHSANAIYGGSSDLVRPTAVKVRFKTRYA